ncbi:hypothetical protein Tco_1426173 [Tanacetum coccineum]
MDEPMVDPEFDDEVMDDDDGDVVDAPNPSTYEVGGPSTAIAAQPQVIDDLYREMDNLRERQGALTRTMLKTLQTTLYESRSKNQQLQTKVAEMHSREGALMQYMMWMEERLTVLEKRLPGLPPGAQIMAPKQMSQAAIAKLVSDEVAKALAAHRATRNATGAGGHGNVEGAGNAGGPERAQQARDCTFSSFMKCGPTQFHGKEGAIKLCRWFEKMESTFGISECAERSKVKFAAATLQGRALTWWNTQVATLGLAEANGKPWDDMKKMILEEFCPEEEAGWKECKWLCLCCERC